MASLTQPTLFDVPDAAALPLPSEVENALESLASTPEIEARGAVFTRVEVVEFILDLVGYVDSEPLHQRRILEPALGTGDFLMPMVDRLLAAWRRHAGTSSASNIDLSKAIRGVELHRKTFADTREALMNRLKQEGFSVKEASELASQWLVQGDFLLEPQEALFDYVVGNPPYVRQELIPAPLLREYRRRYQTVYDRADLYIPFIERSLALLNNKGVLGFICADRWMKNRYGRPLRSYIARDFHLKAFIDMVDTKAFHSEVSTYPAITLVTRSKAGATRVAYRPKIEKEQLASLAADINSPTLPKTTAVREMIGVVKDSAPWLLEPSKQMALIRRIEYQFPTMEQVGCKVGIGVATGADKVFIGGFNSLEVESDRKLPLVVTRDIQSGCVVWSGLGVVNPFANNGRLVDLRNYPRLSRYFEAHKTTLTKRHCARKAPTRWYRTIDRIWPKLTHTPKLLIPDIQGEAHIVYEPGELYPHHNLYYIVSESWDLRALQAVLLSNITRLFVAAYSTKIAGDYLRFQAQYLRRIRLPHWQDVPENLRQQLVNAATAQDMDACNNAVFELYNLNQEERFTLIGDST